MAPIKKPSRWTNAQYVPPTRRRLIIRTHGPQKCGKTRLSLTGPQPVFVQSFDPNGIEGVVEPLLEEGRDIRVLEYDFNPNKNAAKAESIMQQFLDDYEAACDVGHGTISWDETEFWRLFRYARLGDKSDRQNAFDDLYDEYTSLIRKAFGSGMNLVLTQKEKDKWISKLDPAKGKMVGHNTGEQIASGCRVAPSLVQVNLRQWRELVDGQSIFYTYVEDARIHEAQPLVGMTFENIDFATLAMGIYPSTVETDWE